MSEVEKNTTGKYFVVYKDNLYIGDESLLTIEKGNLSKLHNYIDVEFLKKFLNIFEDEVHPLEELLEVDFQGYTYTLPLRRFIFENGYLTNPDGAYLSSMNFNQEDLRVRIRDLGLRPQSIRALSDKDIDYLWELLLIDEQKLRLIDSIGDKSIDEMEEKVRQYGYHLKSNKKVKPVVVTKPNMTEEQSLFEDIYKLLDARKVYEFEVKEKMELMRKTNNEITSKLQQLEQIFKRR